MPQTVFPAHPFEATADGAESGNKSFPRHFTVRGALAAARYIWLGLTAFLDEGNPGEMLFGNGIGNAWGTAKAANLGATSLPTATAPTVTPQGAGSGTTIVYLIVAKLGDGSNSPAGPTGQTTTGYANITLANQGMVLTWTAVPGAYSYDIYRTTSPTTPSTTGKIANVLAPLTTLLDNGLAGDTTTAPVTNLTGGVNNLASAGGAIAVCGSISELMVLNTGGLTTDSVAKMLPANSEILGVAIRVTTTITTSTGFSVGDGSTAARFLASGTAMTAGTTAVGLAHGGTASCVQAAAASLRITALTSNPGAGAIRVTVFYQQYVPPTA